MTVTIVLALVVLLVLAGAAVLVLKNPFVAMTSSPAAEGQLALVISPNGQIDATALRTVKFPVVLRGYRQEDVDALLAQLAEQLQHTSTSAKAVEAHTQASQQRPQS